MSNDFAAGNIYAWAGLPPRKREPFADRAKRFFLSLLIRLGYAIGGLLFRLGVYVLICVAVSFIVVGVLNATGAMDYLHDKMVEVIASR